MKDKDSRRASQSLSQLPVPLPVSVPAPIVSATGGALGRLGLALNQANYLVHDEDQCDTDDQPNWDYLFFISIGSRLNLELVI